MVIGLRYATLALAISASGPVSSVLAQAVPPSVRACASERDDAQRLSCYDREIARLDQGGAAAAAPSAKAEAATATAAATAAASATPTTAPATTTASPTPTTAPDAKFGYRGSVAREEHDRQAAADEGGDRMEATITDVSSRPHGELVVTLDNGQIWAQKAPDSKMHLKAGDRITIKKASLGSYMLVAAGRSTRVTRVK
jgi:pyruvate/2-oxoglutarate dehydrogenase complex dihydrolipoamide acyltransferase (E2) component